MYWALVGRRADGRAPDSKRGLGDVEAHVAAMGLQTKKGALTGTGRIAAMARLCSIGYLVTANGQSISFTGVGAAS